MLLTLMVFEHEHQILLFPSWRPLPGHNWRRGWVGDYFIKAYQICRDYLELPEQNFIVDCMSEGLFSD